MKELIYEPEKFSRLYGEIGEPIWNFLINEKVLIRLFTSADLDRPAVKAIETVLLNEPTLSEIVNLGERDSGQQKRIRQMIGHMIKQIMLYHGYQLDAQNVRYSLTKNDYFTSGSKYKKFSRNL